MIANEALKIAVLSAIDDEDASDEVVGEFIDTAFDDYNEHVGKLLDSAADGAAEAKARQRRKDKLEAERRAAMQRGTMKQQRWETDMDRMLTFAKAVAAGAPTTITKAQFFQEISNRADAERKASESHAQAFARSAETDVGKVLMQAHKLAPGPYYVFERPAPTAPVRKAGAAMDKLMQLAADHRQANPGVTPEAAFAAVYTDPANKDVVAQHKAELAEQSSIDAARHWPGVAQTFRPAGAQEHVARVS